MKKDKAMRRILILAVSLTAIALASGVANAQSAQLEGLITGRSGATMTVQTPTSGNVVVVLTPATQVDEVQGVFHARKKQYAVTALVPGLSVQVQGAYNAQNQMVADSVKFKGSSLSTAQDIQAGVAPVQQQEQQQQQQIAQQQQQLAQQQAQLASEKAAQEEQAAKIAANKAAIEAANKRFGELGEYNILGEVTVYFANGSVAVEAQYKPQLMKLAQQAKGITGYIIQVQGYASAVGSAALNQKLSQERASNVLDYVEQDCGIPLTNVLAPGAMGTADQVAPDSSTEGQAANRRVVVRILQNKGIAGT